MESKELDVTTDPAVSEAAAVAATAARLEPYDIVKDREGTRADLARGLLWLLTFLIGGVLVFIGLGLLDGTVLTQSVFPSIVALAGTALGFYFGSEGRQGTSVPPQSPPAQTPPAPSVNQQPIP